MDLSLSMRIRRRRVSGFTGLLDTISGAVVAYSIGRRLTKSFSGSLIRVRRSSDGAELDIGYDADNILDISALDTHCSATDGFVVKIYDQAGGSDDMVQSTASGQPKICSSGTTIVDGNGNPIAQFDGTDDTMQAASVAIDSYASVYVVGTFTTAKPMFIEHSANAVGNDGFFFFGTTGNAWRIERSPNTNTTVGDANWMGASLAQVSLINSATGTHYLNGSAEQTASVDVGDTEVIDDLNLLSRNGTSVFSDGDFYEMIIWDGAHSSGDQSTVESDQKTKYSTP